MVATDLDPSEAAQLRADRVLGICLAEGSPNAHSAIVSRSLGIPMQVIAINAKLLRDQAGNNMYYTTNSITLGGGESLDVILDTTGIPKGTYYLYTSNLDHLSNDAENFGGLMTEVRVN
jgi:hypothetical protein